MAKKFNGECLVRCKECGAVNTVVWKDGLIRDHWVFSNRKCNHKMDLKKIETVICPHCGKLVQRDPKNICLNCGKFIYQTNDVFQAECSHCGVINLIPNNFTGTAYCAVCGEEIKISEEIRRRKRPIPGAAVEQIFRLKDISAMEKDKLIISKHPVSEFPAKSQLQVSEGTWGLLLQNGACQYPLGPGIYPLEKTNLTKAGKLDAAAAGEDIVFYTDVFCVRKTLPEIGWGTGRNPVVVQNTNAVDPSNYQLKSNGSIIWQVSDAKAFVERYGFKEITENELINPEEEKTNGSNTEQISKDGPLVLETRKALSDALRSAAANLIERETLDPTKLKLKQADLVKQLITELDHQMDKIGLTVNSLWIDDLDVSKIVDTRYEEIRKAAETSYRWKVEGIKLYPTENLQRYAEYSFSGTARMKITDKDRFVQTPEIQNLMAEDSQKQKTDDSENNNLFQKIVTETVQACITAASQEMLKTERIPVRNLYLYTRELAENLRSLLDSRLDVMGLQAEQVNFDQPTYNESPELKREAETEERKKKLIQYAEKPLYWVIDNLNVHMKDKKALSATVSFQGNATLQVKDVGRFFNQSTILEFLESDQFPGERPVKQYYEKMITDHFYAKLAGLTQSMIDSRGWDVRELERYGEQLKELAVQTLDDLLADRGLRVESAYMGSPMINLSRALAEYKDVENYQEHIRTEEEKIRTENAHTVYVEKTGAETEKAVDDIQADLYQHRNENRISRMQSDERMKDAVTDTQVADIERDSRVSEAEKQAKLKEVDHKADIRAREIEGEAKVDRAEDQRKAARGDRAFDEMHKEQQRKHQLDRENQESDIAKREMEQEGRHRMERAEEEHKKILADIQRAVKLDDKKFEEALNGILHRIDESNLDWRKKLEEYERLSRNLGVRDTEDARRLVAETDRDIAAMQAGTKQDSAMKQIELNSAQAQLQETIDRYAEDRDERKAAADYARKEREKVLLFEQSMEDRKEKAEQELTKLQAEYAEEQRKREHEERLEQLKAENEKLKLELEAQKHRITMETDLGKTKSTDEAREKEAEFKYRAEKEAAERAAAEERAQKQAAREDDLMKRAEALFKYVRDLEDATTKARMDLQKHTDDNETQVRRDYAQVEKVRAEGLNERQREEIINRLDDLEKAITRSAESEKNSTGNSSASREETENILKKIKEIIDKLDDQQKDIKELKKAVKAEDDKSGKYCPRCGNAMPRNARFCMICGAGFYRTGRNTSDAVLTPPQPGTGTKCNVCGGMNAAGATVCVHCGADI